MYQATNDMGQEESWESITHMDILEHVQNESSYEWYQTRRIIEIHNQYGFFEVCSKWIRLRGRSLKWIEENAESEDHILIVSEMKKNEPKRKKEQTLKRAKSLDFLQLLRFT